MTLEAKVALVRAVNPAGFVRMHEAPEAEVTALTARRPVSADQRGKGLTHRQFRKPNQVIHG